MARRNLADDFALLQRESQRAVELLRSAMVELEPRQAKYQLQPELATIVKREAARAYSRHR